MKASALIVATAAAFAHGWQQNNTLTTSVECTPTTPYLPPPTTVPTGTGVYPPPPPDNSTGWPTTTPGGEPTNTPPAPTTTGGEGAPGNGAGLANTAGSGALVAAAFAAVYLF